MPKKFSPKKFLFSTLVLTFLVFIGFSVFMLNLFTPVDKNDQTDQQFIVPKGQSVTRIGERLKEAGLIKNVLAFRLVIKRDNLSNKIQAGSFKINKAMPISQIAEALTTGTQDTWVTLQEGWRNEEIAESIARQNFTEFEKDEFIALAKGSEGKLFPDTYLVPLQIDAQQFYDLLTSTYERKTSTLDFADNPQNLTPNQVLILASLVEREGRGVQDMRNVAGILINRLRIEMPLQVDATLQYANGFDKVQQTWWREPLAKDKDISSPYNTYLNSGLPPTPICNPGLDAIQAVLNPIPSENLFYLHDSSGIGRYAQTYDEHLANINKYLR